MGGKFGGGRRKSGENKELSKKEELKEKENVLKKDAYQAIILQLKINKSRKFTGMMWIHL